MTAFLTLDSISLATPDQTFLQAIGLRAADQSLMITQ